MPLTRRSPVGADLQACAVIRLASRRVPASKKDVWVDGREPCGIKAHEPFSHTLLGVEVITCFRLGQPSVRAENIVTCEARAH